MGSSSLREGCWRSSTVHDDDLIDETGRRLCAALEDLAEEVLVAEPD